MDITEPKEAINKIKNRLITMHNTESNRGRVR